MAKTRGPSAKAYYAAYKSQNKYATNRRKKLERTLKEQPNNEQIVAALKNITYRRKTPNTRMWSSTKRKVAGMFKEFTGSMNYNVFNTNDMVRTLAVNALKSNKTAAAEKVSFKLGARAHDGHGNLVWK
jgi:hypothetical protein